MHIRRFRRAMVVAAATASFAALGAGSGVGAGKADVTLQVVPRGDGHVTSSVAPRPPDEPDCGRNEGASSCEWKFPAGTTVVLTAKPDLGGSFARWSTPDCPGTGDCRLTLDSDTTIVALFGKLRLEVQTSGARPGDLVTSDPAGISCPGDCSEEYAVGTNVRLTVRTGADSKFTSFPFGCLPPEGPSCTVTVFDQPQVVGVKFNNQPGPEAPSVVKVTVKIAKAGTGAGRVTANGLDCGTVCSASFPYGTLAAFTATPDAGSVFGGWGGICAANDQPRCTLPIGPITHLRPQFARESPPSAPGQPRVTTVTRTSLTVTWDAATDDVGVKGYDVSVGNGSPPAASTASTTATVGGLVCGKTYTLSVVAFDGAGNRSPAATTTGTTAPCPLRVTLASSKVTRTALVCRLRATAGARGSATLTARGSKPVRKKVAVRNGVNALTFKLPRSARGTRVALVLRLADPDGGTRVYSWSFRVPR